jgi:hypothetical protein
MRRPSCGGGRARAPAVLPCTLARASRQQPSRATCSSPGSCMDDRRVVCLLTKISPRRKFPCLTSEKRDEPKFSCHASCMGYSFYYSAV